MSRQSSLTSFFGRGTKSSQSSGSKPKRKSLQTKLNDAKKTKTTASKKNEADISPKKKRKIIDDDLVDTDDEMGDHEKENVQENVNIEMEMNSSIEDKKKKINSNEPNEKERNTPLENDNGDEDDDDDDSIKTEEYSAKSDEDDDDDEDEDEDEVMNDSEDEKESVKLSSLKAPSKGTKNKSEKIDSLEVNMDDIPWEAGDSIPYSVVCDTFIEIEKISSRLQIQDILTKLFQKVFLTTPKDVSVLIYLASNTVAPAYDCVELGIGDSILEKAIGEASGTNPCKLCLFFQ